MRSAHDWQSLHEREPAPASVCCRKPGLRGSAGPQDGKQVLTGWSDGKVRVFGPESGKELFSIHDAHHGEVRSPGLFRHQPVLQQSSAPGSTD